MPTSSQYLILKAYDGTLPPVFGRRRWTPESSYPLTSIDFTERSMHVRKPRKSDAFPYSPRRPGSAPNLQLLPATLPDMLKIHRLRGSLRYDIESNSLHWQVPSQDIEQFREINRGWTPGTIRAQKLTPRGDKLRYQKGLNAHAMDISTSDILRFMPRSDKTVRLAEFDEKLELQNVSNRNTALINHEPPLTFVKIQEENMKCAKSSDLITTDADSADYFKITLHPYETNSYSGHTSTFRLARSNIDEPGSFRLAKTAANEVGDYCLVPADGFESDDFRLVMSDNETDNISLLQANPEKEGQFRLVENTACETGEFHLVQAASTVNESKRRPNSPTVNYSFHPTNTGKGVDRTAAEGTAIRGQRRRTDQQYKTDRVITRGNLVDTMSSANRYTFSRDMTDDEATTDGLFLPDMSLYDSQQTDALHPPDYKSNSQFDVELSKRHLETEMAEFKEKYKDSYREVSSGNYERLLQLGFRRGSDDVPPMARRQTGGNDTVDHKNYTGQEWRTHNFDNWSRTTDFPKRHSTALENTRKQDLALQQPTKSSEDQDGTLLDEVKHKANYKQWKRSHITAVRMRKELPASDPRAVCVTLHDNAVSHDQLKQMVETSTSCKLSSLQFDPVSVHSLDKGTKSQWILRFTNTSVCDTLIISGLLIDGKQYPVRRFDDVMKEEHNAYKYVLLLDEMKRRKAEKRDGSKSVKNIQNRKVRATQTPTSTQRLLPL